MKWTKIGCLFGLAWNLVSISKLENANLFSQENTIQSNLSNKKYEWHEVVNAQQWLNDLTLGDYFLSSDGKKLEFTKYTNELRWSIILKGSMDFSDKKFSNLEHIVINQCNHTNIENYFV